MEKFNKLKRKYMTLISRINNINIMLRINRIKIINYKIKNNC